MKKNKRLSATQALHETTMVKKLRFTLTHLDKVEKRMDTIRDYLLEHLNEVWKNMLAEDEKDEKDQKDKKDKKRARTTA